MKKLIKGNVRSGRHEGLQFPEQATAVSAEEAAPMAEEQQPDVVLVESPARGAA